jgi:two-component system OmpR family sensor kinase
MAQAGRRRVWQSITDLSERMPLRVKLISTVLTLVAVALVVISVAGLLILRGDLLSTPDASLTAYVGTAQNAVSHYLDTGNTLHLPNSAVDWITAGRIHQVIVPTSGAGPGSYGGVFQQTTEPGPAIQASSSWLAQHSNHPFTVPGQSGARWRVLLVPTQYTDSAGASINGTVAIAVNVTSVYTTIGELAYIDLLVSLAVICVLGILVVALIRRSLRPLIDIERTAGAIADGDLSRRVPERDPRTEVGRLGRSLNVMLSQIESAFHARARSEESARRSEQKMRQFVADASHELRTPLTAIRGFAEYYRHRGGIDITDTGAGELTPADLDRIMRRVEQEASRMGILVEDMLLLARLDQQRPLEARPVDLLSLAADAVHDARVVAPNRSINLTVGSGAALLVIGDEVRLRQVIGNLMSNALSHTPDGTPIDVLIRSGNLDEAPAAPAEPDELAAEDSEPATDDAQPSGTAESTGAALQRAGPAAVLEVRDHGPGLTPAQAEHVFERFYRADQARTSGGTGLGLAIVAALVAAHGGTTWVRSEPGDGATFSIALPLSPEAAQGSGDDFADAEDEPDEGAADGSAPVEHFADR